VTVRLTLSVDRFEGDDHAIAVLVTDDGEAVNMPRSLLPPGVEAGDVLTFAIGRDRGATGEVAGEAARIQRELSEGDPGGDIRL
jgi:hypothetical protein